MKIIKTKEEFLKLKKELKEISGLKEDWQDSGLIVEVRGKKFNNHGVWGYARESEYDLNKVPLDVIEQYVIIKKGDFTIAEINLADLFAWAGDYNESIF